MSRDQRSTPNASPEPDPAADAAALAEVERQVREEIRAHGFHVVLVQSDGSGPAYGFTVGLWSSYRHPEIVVFGLDDGEQGGPLHELLDLAGERVRDGERFVVGTLVEGLVDRFACAVRPVAPQRVAEYLDFVHRIAGTGPEVAVEVVQLVWPDARGRFPWDAGFAKDLAPLQPLLGK
ncbi:MAG: DUF4262 domain-containing protein [Planctomycetes bacterium]|nr:DUF4262 domain-containing protein [Planctomycetota bacterium]